MPNIPLFLLCTLFGAAAAAQDFFQLIREGNTSGLAAQLASGSANAGIRDEFGATPLHYAAAYGTARDVELLLRSGADVQAATKEGSTALLWATGDSAKVRLLLQAGADMNAKSQSGITPMLAAAFRNNTEVMRLLAAAGADLKGEVALFPRLPLRVGLQHLASMTNDSSLRNLLGEWKIAPPESPQGLVLVPGSQPLAGPFILTSFSMRPQVTPGVASAVDAMLQLGADPTADIRQLARALPPVAIAASFSDDEAVRLLLKKGANPNRAGTLASRR